MKGPQAAENPAYAQAAPAERKAALVASCILLAIGVAAIPARAILAGETDALLPSVTSAGLTAMIVSAAILRNQYRASRFAPYAFLACAFGSTGALLVPYMLTFPRVFSANGYGTGSQVSAWLWVAWHASFILSIGAYVWAESYFTRKDVSPAHGARVVQFYVLAVTVATASVVALLVVFHRSLPVLVTHAGYAPVFHSLVEQLLMGSTAIVLFTLVARSRLRHTTHLWLGVVLVAFGVEIYVSGEVVQRLYSIAWYVGLVQGMAWQAMFLGVQLHHANEQLAAFVNDKRELIEETQRDALTGLYNRRGFDERFEQALHQSRVARTPVSLLALDLDHFKSYNDHFGHLAGDDALRAIAKTLGTIANRTGDSCCRVGGEEFAIVLSVTDESAATTVAERVRASIMRLQIPQAPNMPMAVMTVSIGIASADGLSPITGKTLYEYADKALYRAKRMGRNRISLASTPEPSSLRAV
jgi:diguanylate cyclase (GGDEF)-like protein